MPKLILVCYIVGLLLALPTRTLCAEPPLCGLGASIVEQMNLLVAAGDKLDPIVLTGSVAFVEECPASVIPAFRRFAINEKGLHHSWIEALRSAAEMPANGDLREFLAAAKESIDHNGNASVREFLDGIFEVSGRAQVKHRLPVDRLFGRLSLATLRQFPRCEATECYDVSDFLLFLLGTHPAAFLGAMHADQPDAAKWLSQLGDLSFVGYPSDRQRCDSIREFLLERISKLETTEFPREKYECENVLRQIRFRAWK